MGYIYLSAKLGHDPKNTWNTKWILLGGDTNVILHREAYSNFQGNNEFIPADLYYSDLNGNWDDDNDGIYGEVADNIDFYPDVFVGRAPVDTVDEAHTFVSKTIVYEGGPLGYEAKVLFLAEMLDSSTDGGIAKNIIDDNYIPDTFSVTKLYESLGNLNKVNAMNELNAGYGIVNHIGHGGVSVIGIGPDALYNANMDSLTNSPRNSIFYSISCHSNSFEQNSFSEHFVLNPAGGGIAYIGNSRYGWYASGYAGEGYYSEGYDQQFFNSLFKEHFYHIGQAHADAKIYYIPSSSSDGAYRWTQYALNLLGDPETQIWTSIPPELSVTVDAPATVEIDDIFTVTATISNSGTETASNVEATISWIPESGLSTTDALTQTVGDGDITGGDSKIVSWIMSADAIGTYDITVDASATNAETVSDASTIEVTPPITLEFQDSFEDGTLGPEWVQDPQNDWFVSTQRATDGSRSAEVDGGATDATLTLANAINLAEKTSATLTFDWLIERGLDSGEYLCLDLYDGEWHEYDCLDGNVDPENVWHRGAIDLSSYLVSDFNVRFRAKMSNSLEDANVDNVIITSITLPKTPKLSVLVSAPTSVEVGTSFIVDATISNSGEETATGVNAIITLPGGLSTTEPLTKSVADILGGGSATVSWDVSADTEGAYVIKVDTSATNAEPASGTATVEVITPDITPPTVILTDPSDNAYISTESYTVTAAAFGDESGVASVEFQYSLNEGSTWISIGTDTISPYEVTWNLNEIADRTGILVKAIATDNAGLTAEDINSGITHDSTPPTATISINNGADYTTTTEVTLILTYSDTISGIDGCRYSNDALSWSEWETCTESKTWTLTTGDGTKMVYYEVKDNAGNVKQVTDTIVLDTIPPTGSVTINDDATYTTSFDVTLTISATDANGVIEMMVSNDEEFTGATWESYAMSKPWTLTTGDGTKTVYVMYKDNVGLESTIYWDDIILDTTPPVQVKEVTVTTISSSELSISWTGNTEPDLHHYHVYRSTTSGGPYDLVASPTTNSYLDAGLTASTTYYYKITATDEAGNEGELSGEVSGTTEEPANVMHIADINMSTTRIKLNGWYTYATATVTIVDANGSPVAGAGVYGTWSGLTSDSGFGTTDSYGKVALDSDSVKNAAGTFTFTVDDVTKTDWIYNPEENVETSDNITV